MPYPRRFWVLLLSLLPRSLLSDYKKGESFCLVVCCEDLGKTELENVERHNTKRRNEYVEL